MSTIRKLLHVIWVSTNDEIPETVPKDVYYVYRLGNFYNLCSQKFSKIVVANGGDMYNSYYFNHNQLDI